MNPERERIEVSRKEIPIQDANGDAGGEERVYYSDGSWIGQGDIRSGKNQGKKWIKGHGGVTDGPIDLRPLGIDGAVEQTSTNDWGYMVEGGREPGQPKTGDNWFKPVLHHETEIPPEHDEGELTLRAGVDRETDDQGRPTYEVKRYGEKVIITRRTYHDAEGYMVETGKHVAGPERGKIWEARRPLVSLTSEASLLTPSGSLRELSVRGLVIDRQLSEAERGFMTPEQQEESTDRMRRAATVEMRGARFETPATE